MTEQGGDDRAGGGGVMTEQGGGGDDRAGRCSDDRGWRGLESMSTDGKGGKTADSRTGERRRH